MNSTLTRQFAATIKLVAALFLATAAPAFCADVPLHYLPESGLDSATILAPPPILGSDEHAADMAQVVAVHHATSSNNIQLAYSEKKFSIFNFAPAIGNFFTSNNLPRTTAFMQRVQDEAEVVTDVAKNLWKRPRPYTTDPSLANGKLEKSFSYPSGHSTEGTVLALVLAELCPEKEVSILATGRDLGWHRVWIARHYPTDIHAGRVMARAIVEKMKANPEFQHDFAEAKKEILEMRVTANGNVEHAAASTSNQ